MFILQILYLNNFFLFGLLSVQETADMLKSHIKEELMQGEEDESVYESMAHLSTDLLMKCSLNPGSDEELYESMAGFVPGAPEDLCMYNHYDILGLKTSVALSFSYLIWSCLNINSKG